MINRVAGNLLAQKLAFSGMFWHIMFKFVQELLNFT